MPARVNFTDAGVAFEADAGLAQTAQLVAKLRLAIDAGVIPEGATLPSIRAGAEELGVHSNTVRKVYAALEAQGYATTRHGSGTIAHARDAAGAVAVRRIAEGALASARGEGADAQLVAMAILAGGGAPAAAPSAGRQETTPRQPRRRAPRPAQRAQPPVLPPDVMRGSYVGLVTSDEELIARARGEAERRGVRLRVAAPRDDQSLGDLVWGCELVIVGRDARDDEIAQRVLRSARDLLEMA